MNHEEDVALLLTIAAKALSASRDWGVDYAQVHNQKDWWLINEYTREVYGFVSTLGLSKKLLEVADRMKEASEAQQ